VGVRRALVAGSVITAAALDLTSLIVFTSENGIGSSRGAPWGTADAIPPRHPCRRGAPLPSVVTASYQARRWAPLHWSGLWNIGRRCPVCPRFLLSGGTVLWPEHGPDPSAPPVTGLGRVRMWRGGLRCGLSVSAPFVWRCLTSRTITPFPHPSHRTGHAELPHPALGQDACLRTRKVSCRPPAHRTGPCCPGGQRPDELQTTASVAPWASIRSPDRNPSSLFASACGAFRSCRTLQEFPRVTPISRASLLSAPVLN
jgi:hypothetical protein